MRRFILSLTAVAALGLVVPYAAPAKAEETIVVRHGDHGDHGWRHHHHDKVVVIKHHRHDD